MAPTPTKMGRGEQIGTRARTRLVSAKPLFIGSIPIAASNYNLNQANSLARGAGCNERKQSVQKKA
jgi:hypothetical protein